MSTNHNRIKVADLETNEPDKILTTNSTGELEFSNISSIKIDSYNGLDYALEGKALDARQGKILKDLIDSGNLSAKKHKTIFVGSKGNDATATPSDPNLPYTLNGAINWLKSQSHLGFGWYIEILDSGTYTSTNTFTLSGFNIINNNGGTVKIQNSFTVNKEWIFDFRNGNLYFETMPTTTLVSSSFKGAETEYINHYVKNVTFIDNNSILTSNDRGWFRGFASTGSLFWKNTTIDTNSTRFGSTIRNEVNMLFENIVNNSTNIYGKAFFDTVDYLYTSSIKINKYTNGTAVNQAITGYKKLEIGNITSTNALTILQTPYLSFNSDTTFSNVQIGGMGTSTGIGKVVVNGNSNTITFNNTIGTYLINQSAGPSPVRSTSNYSTNIDITFKDIKFVIGSTSSITHFISIDLRSGRNGIQMILDNVVFIFQNNARLLNIFNQASLVTTVKYQIIFRNSVRIMNNNYLVTSDSTVTQPDDLLVQENASIFHDFGQISNNTKIQTSIPKNNTY